MSPKDEVHIIVFTNRNGKIVDTDRKTITERINIMIQIKNGRLQKYGLSFALPEGFFLETQSEVGQEDGLEFWSEDETLQMHIDFFCDEENSEETLKSWFLPDSVTGSFNFVLLEPISPVSLDGISGYTAIYRSGDDSEEHKEYYELRLDLGKTEDGYLQFAIVLQVHKGNVYEVVYSSLFRNILKNIEKV